MYVYISIKNGHEIPIVGVKCIIKGGNKILVYLAIASVETVQMFAVYLNVLHSNHNVLMTNAK